MTSLIRFYPKTPGTSCKDFEVDLLRVERGGYPQLKGHRGSVAQTFLHVSSNFCGCKLFAPPRCLARSESLHFLSVCSTAPSSRRRASCGLMLVRSISRRKTFLMKMRSSAGVAPSWKCELRAVRIIDLIVSFSFEDGTATGGLSVCCIRSTLGRFAAALMSSAALSNELTSGGDGGDGARGGRTR